MHTWLLKKEETYTMHFSMELLLGFEKLGKDDVGIAGGKGASLGEMTQAGIPVPGGFVILSQAFEKFLEENNLHHEIDAILSYVKPDQNHMIEDASQKIQSLILKAPIPSFLTQEIELYYKSLNVKYVAVRSSATAEDSASAAWAGQLDSYLNTNEKTLIENVKKCWASLFTPRAIFYRFEKKLHTQKISVAVVVQKMIESEKSGIAFSVHPVTQDKNQLIIEAGLGLGEAIVSGAVTPDNYVIEKNPRKIIDKNVFIQEKGLFRAQDGGNEWRDIEKHIGEKSVLSDHQILELSALILNIEDHYGFPCDIEWAFENDNFYIVQSRPITTLIDDESSEVINVPLNWKNAFMLGNQDIDTSFLNLEMTWAGMWDNRIFEQIGLCVPDTFEEITKGSTINTYVLSQPINEFVETAAHLLHTKPKLLQHLKENTIKTAEKIRNFADVHIHHIEEYDIKKLSQILLNIKELQSDCVAYGTVVAWADITGSISQKIVDIIQQRTSLKYPCHWYSNVLGSPEVVSITEQAKKDIQTLNLSEEEILKKYYWLDQGYIGNGLTIEQLKHIKNQFHTVNEDTMAAADELKAELNLTPEEWHYFQVSRDIIFMKALRSDSRQYLHVIVNKIAQILGKFWDIDSSLVSVMYAEEIFEIIHENKTLPDNLSERYRHSVLIPQKAGLYQVLSQKHSLRFLSTTLQRENISTSDTIKGQTAYQGLVRGTVRLVFGPQHNEKVQEGDILVSTATSPQLLPAMIRAAAFVTDVGGITSHAAIVARELKKTCIVGAKYATQILKDGDVVEVDADLGEIRIISKFQNFIKDRQMEKWEGNFSLLLLGTGIGGCLHPYSEKYDFNFGQWIFIVNGKHGVAFVDFNKYIDITLRAYKKFVAKKGKLTELFDFENLWKQINTLYISCSPLKLEKMSNQDLEEAIKKAFELMRGIIGSTVFVESLDESQIKTHFYNIDKDGDFDTFFKNASMPNFHSFALRTDKRILENPHSPELQYIFADYYLVPSIMEIDNKLEELITERGGVEKIKEEVCKIEQDLEENKNNINRFRAGLNDKMIFLFDFVQVCMYTRDIRKDPLQKVQTILSNAMRQYFERNGINPENAAFALYDDFIKNKNQQVEEYRQEIEKRSQQGVSALFSDEEILFEYGKTEEKLQSIFKARDLVNTLQLTGNVAYHGNVKGKVRVILSQKDFHKFNKGEILVTSMTRPEFVPLMKKASAVITDEGGITCHAAIVSRELKIPCIIGTKVATRTLKDGNEVEIDCDNGVINVIDK